MNARTTEPGTRRATAAGASDTPRPAPDAYEASPPATRPSDPTRRRVPELARRVLEMVDESGPAARDEIPHGWPLTRMHLSYAIDVLVKVGAAEWTDATPGSGRRLRVTAEGERILAAAGTSGRTAGGAPTRGGGDAK